MTEKLSMMQEECGGIHDKFGVPYQGLVRNAKCLIQDSRPLIQDSYQELPEYIILTIYYNVMFGLSRFNHLIFICIYRVIHDFRA
jgi:hypothetical protein